MGSPCTKPFNFHVHQPSMNMHPNVCVFAAIFTKIQVFIVFQFLNLIPYMFVWLEKEVSKVSEVHVATNATRNINMHVDPTISNINSVIITRHLVKYRFR